MDGASGQFAFKVPQIVPQDLLLIHDLVGEITSQRLAAQPIHPKTEEEDSIDSSDNETVSEDEVEAGLLTQAEEENGLAAAEQTRVPSSDSDSESSDSEDDKEPPGKPIEIEVGDDNDEHIPASGTYFQTKNELAEADITIPDIEEVGPEEVLEKVGEVMSIIDRIAIVKGVSSENANRASQRALDSDTLLVFEDRKVMGYVYETFGPTHQPLYQVKFNQAYPLDPEKVRISREVFQVPQRSHFVFLNQLKRLKGSDASNVNDEEPAEDELEFSDDEQEQAFRAARKRQGRSRSNSVVSSRQPTPTPSQMRDQDMTDDTFSSMNPYLEHGAYDMDFSAGPSRPRPVPYDDPYSDNFNTPVNDAETSTSVPKANGLGKEGDRSWSPRGGRGKTRERSDSRSSHREVGGRSRGRGRGRGRGENKGRRSSGDGNGWANRTPGRPSSNYSEEYDPRLSRPLSPTSIAIARATGQYLDSGVYSHETASQPSIPPDATGWGFQQDYQLPQQQFDFDPQNGQQQLPYVQPHINPRFASAFGMNVGFAQSPTYGQYGQHYLAQGYGSAASPHENANWSDEWTIHGQQNDTSSTTDASGDGGQA